MNLFTCNCWLFEIFNFLLIIRKIFLCNDQITDFYWPNENLVMVGIKLEGQYCQ